MSRKALMAAAAVVVVAGVAVVTIGPASFLHSSRPVTATTEHLSSIGESGVTPATPVTTGLRKSRIRLPPCRANRSNYAGTCRPRRQMQ